MMDSGAIGRVQRIARKHGLGEIGNPPGQGFACATWPDETFLSKAFEVMRRIAIRSADPLGIESPSSTAAVDRRFNDMMEEGL